MVKNVKDAQTLVDLIYSLEPLCYYFRMKPYEFWNSSYREINLYTKSNLCHVMDDFRQEIRLQEAVTDKMIMADAMSNRRPKILPLQKTFKNLFQNSEEQTQSPEEIARRFRTVMDAEKKHTLFVRQM